MLIGRVTVELEAVLRLTVGGAAGRTIELDAVVDSGFNGFLTLPPETIASLGLRYNSDGVAELGDGSFVSMRRFEGVVLWNGQERRIIVDKADGGVLLGMSLLKDHHLGVDVRERGRVTIDPLPI